MTHRCRTVAAQAAGLLVAAVLTGWAGPADAAAPVADCDAPVVDLADVLDDEAVLQAAAAARIRVGADVRVRSYSSVPAGDLESRLAAEQARCASWRGAEGLRRDNLLVLAVSVQDRATWLLYGEQWVPALDPVRLELQTARMNPAFAAGDFTGGMTAGIAAAAEAIDPPVDAGAPPVPASPDRPGRTVDGPLPVLRDEASDAGRYALAGAAGLTALGGGGYGAVALRRRLRRRDVARAQAREAAVSAAGHFGVVQQQRPLVQGHVDLVLAAVSDEDDAVLVAELQATLSDSEAAERAYAQAHGTWYPEAVDRADQVEAISATDAWRQADALLAAAVRRLEETARRVETVQEQLATLPGRLDALDAALAAAYERVAVVRGLGYRTEAVERRLARQAATLADARACAAATRVAAAVRRCDEAERGTAAAVSEAEGLPELHQQLVAGLQQQRRVHGSAAAAADRAGDTLRLLQDRSSPDDWDGLLTPVQGLPGNLAVAAEQLDQVESGATLEAQEWALAQAALIQATGALEQVLAVASRVQDVAARSATAEQALPGRLAAVGAAVRQAQSFVAEHAADVAPSHEQDLSAARSELGRLEQAAARARPSWIDLSVQIDGLAARVAEVHGAAVREHQQAVEQRAAADRALDAATLAVSEAEGYLDGNWGSGWTATSELQRAQDALQEARSAPHPVEARRLAEEAEERAVSALRSAEAAASRARSAARAAALGGGSRSLGSSGGGGSSSGGGAGGGGSGGGRSGGGGGGGTSW